MATNYDPAVRKYARKMGRPAVHAPRREGDEMACKCGKRWPVEEDHP